MKTTFFILVTLATVFAGVPRSALATPSAIFILRHAEKPKEGSELSRDGQERARALVGFFQHDSRITSFGTPAAIYAMGPSGEEGSVRAIQTMTPLARALGLTLHQSYLRDDIDEVAKEILSEKAYDGRLVVICWEHKVIPDLAEDLGLEDGPEKWSKHDFDRVWILKYDGDRVTDFTDLPQRLMPGDSRH